MNAKECSLLTRYEYARSLSFKLTVTGHDHEIVKDPSMWPQNISIEPYKARKRRNSVTFQTTNRTNQNQSVGDNTHPITGILKRKEDSPNTNRNIVLSNSERTGRNFNFNNEFPNDRQAWLRQPNKSA